MKYMIYSTLFAGFFPCFLVLHLAWCLGAKVEAFTGDRIIDIPFLRHG